MNINLIKTVITLSLFALLLHQLSAQNIKQPKLDKVTIEDLTKKVYELDTSAPAIILYEKGSITYDIEEHQE